MVLTRVIFIYICIGKFIVHVESLLWNEEYSQAKTTWINSHEKFCFSSLHFCHIFWCQIEFGQVVWVKLVSMLTVTRVNSKATSYWKFLLVGAMWNPGWIVWMTLSLASTRIISITENYQMGWQLVHWVIDPDAWLVD